MSKTILKKNNAVAVFLILVGLYVIYSSFSMSIWHESVPEEGFLPFILACILVGLSTILLIGEIREDEAGEVPEPKAEPKRKKLIYYIVAISFYSLSFSLLGFLLSTGISLIFILRWIERESWRTTILVAVGSTIVSYFLFTSLLGVILPLGPLERWRHLLRI